MLKFGHICNIDGFRARVKIDDEDGYITDFLPIVVSNSTVNDTNNPIEIDTPVAISLTNDGQDGVILGAIHTDNNPPIIKNNNKKYYRFKDGSHFEYDPNTHILIADIKGEAIVTANKLTVNSNLFVNGDIYDKKGSMQNMRDIYNNHTNPDGGKTPELM